MLTTLFAEDPQPVPFFLNPMFMLVMLALFWVVIIIPAGRRQRKEQQALMSSLKRGTKVLTNAGIVGTVVTVKDGDDEIVIRSEDARLRIKRATVAQVLGSDESEAAK